MDNKLDDYKKRTLDEQVLKEPDTFVGGSDEIEDVLPLFSENKIVVQMCKNIPAVGKLFDEILVNARDQMIRLDELSKKGEENIIPVTDIKFTYEKDEKKLTIYNNGNGIDIAEHPTEKDQDGKKIWIPDLILGHLLTSKNYNKSGKTTGGKNGFGAKLVNLFSKWFYVETVDHIRGLKYVQEYTDNMSHRTEPKITKTKSKPYTKISWILDFHRFGGIEDFSEDLIQLMVRRVYDIAGTTDKSLSLFYNNKKLSIKSFDKYTDLYLNGESKVYEKLHDRWEISVAVSKNDKFENYSFVNGIFTSKGGKHVDMITKQLTGGIQKLIQKKHKKKIPENYIKNYLKVFVNSVIEDPSFESQSKERLITPPSKFGSKPEVNDKFIKKVLDKLDIADKVISFADFKLNKESKKTDGNKRNKIRDIPKLDDANWAGTKKSEECVLILTEGDSAKSMAISGLSVVGRDKYGAFPLKGKIMNVRDASPEIIMKNAEITNLKKIIGLETGKEYKNTKALRYGKIMIMTDQDHDGSHIKGLVMNIFHAMWPSLLKLGYITSMITPIIKVTKGKKTQSFYTLTEYNEWLKKTKNNQKWSVKYYKGLGTSNAKEAREYFSNMKMNNYLYTKDTDDSIQLAFNKNQSDDRKKWLYEYNEKNILDHNQTEVPIESFIHNELIHFSNSDTFRSIGSLYDGLKPSQRKILYSCFARKLYSEIRVAQLSGYVSEKAAYHHGEVSLQSAIIGMAQNYTGSNNINLLMPNGQFGTRIMGGHDSASSRYIHTELNPIVNSLFPSLDFPLLEYNDDDGVLVEPKYYVPIIPIVLINGMNGIGTGFSTSIPKYNPLDVVENMKRKLQKQPYKVNHPWYKGFEGKIIQLDDNNYMSKGKYTIINNTTIEITELPIGTWTDNYKLFLDKLIGDKKVETNFKKPKHIVDYVNNSSDTEVHFIITVPVGLIQSLQWSENKHVDGIERFFKLTTTKGLSKQNMHLYNRKNQIYKYTSISEIYDDFFSIRYALYVKRKEYYLKILKNELSILQMKIRFIQDVINEEIIIYKQKKDDIIQKLYSRSYLQMKDKEMVEPLKTGLVSGYDYLIKMSIYLFTEEEIEKLNQDHAKKNQEYDNLYEKSIEEIWLSECDEFIKNYKKL